MDDFAAVLRAAQLGDEQAIAVLWRELNPRLVKFLVGRTGDAAEDLASETWLGVAQSIHGFSGGEIEFRAWVFTIARHRLVDWHRREQRRPKTYADDRALSAVVADDDPGVAALETLGTEAALALVGRLSDDQAEVVLLRILGDFDVAQVARITGKRAGNVRMLQHRGLRRLSELLRASDREDLDEDVTR
ncbi:MAG TPA: sigma-70 family RNA polymerase sigma factor [Acidimicrobiia bacterium]